MHTTNNNPYKFTQMLGREQSEYTVRKMFLLNGELQGMGDLPQSLQGGYWVRRKWGERPSRLSCEDGRCLGGQKLAQGQFLAASGEISNEQRLSRPWHTLSSS